MIGYSCKYTPVELIQAFGGEARLLDAEAADFSAAEMLTHANLCCHAKALIQQAQGEEELVLTDCCDATRRAFDVLDAQKPRRFMFQFDLPHDDNGCARARFAPGALPLRQSLRCVSAERVFGGAFFVCLSG